MAAWTALPRPPGRRVSERERAERALKAAEESASAARARLPARSLLRGDDRGRYLHGGSSHRFVGEILVSVANLAAANVLFPKDDPNKRTGSGST